MESIWNIPGLSTELRRTYRELSRKRQLVTIGNEKRVVYSGSLNGMTAGVVELIQRGLVEKKRVGKRTLIILGNWEVVEKRFAGALGELSSVFTNDMVKHLERYSGDQRRVLEQAFIAFGTTRKGGTVSPGVLFRQLQTYDRYPVSAVIEGLRIYLEGGHADTGKNERYALGIIRGCAKAAELKVTEPDLVDRQAAAEEDETVRQRRVRQQEGRAAVDKAVQKLARRKYGEDCDLSRLSPSALSELVCIAKAQLQETTS